MPDITKLPALIDDLNRKGKQIAALTSDSIKIKKIATPVEIYFSDPSVFAEATSKLTPSEKLSLNDIIKLSTTRISPSLSESLTSIISNNPPSLSSDQIQSELQEVLSTNISNFETAQKEYDEINLEIKALELINPLDTIPFRRVRDLDTLFSVSINFMVKAIRNFMIQDLKTTSRPATASRKGFIDFPRTIRASMKYEGDPYELHRKSKAIRTRQVKPAIYFIIDTSGSQDGGIILSIAMTYAIATVLKDYDIVLYTGSYHSFEPDTIAKIEEAEKRNFTETRIVDNITRFNKESILRFGSNPESFKEAIKATSCGNCDDVYIVLKSLINVCPDNSLFITFGDEHAHTLIPYKNKLFNLTVSDKARKLMKKKYKNRVFSFNTTEYWDNNYTRGTVSRTNFNFADSTPNDFKYTDIKYFPTISYKATHTSFSYGDWVREIINVISGFTARGQGVEKAPRL